MSTLPPTKRTPIGTFSLWTLQDTLRSWRDSYDATCSALLPFDLPVGSMDLVILVSQVPQVVPDTS